VFHRIGTFGDSMAGGADVLTRTTNDAAARESKKAKSTDSKCKKLFHKAPLILKIAISVDAGMWPKDDIIIAP
jgi:hypothetical protein